jgi:arylformamidase
LILATEIRPNSSSPTPATGLVNINPGVVHQGVEPAERAQAGVEQPPHVGNLTYVGLQIQTVEQRRADGYGQKFGDEDSQKELSPVTHAAKGKDIPPFLLLHVADHPETKAPSRRPVKALEEAGVPARAYAAEGKTHDTLNAGLGLPDDKPTQALFEFVDGVLKR